MKNHIGKERDREAFVSAHDLIGGGGSRPLLKRANTAMQISSFFKIKIQFFSLTFLRRCTLSMRYTQSTLLITAWQTSFSPQKS
jgi:hypothetical protein